MLAHASLLSGIALSLGTPWGLFRHYWVVLKLAITLFSTIILLMYMATFRQMAAVAGDPVVQLGLVRSPSPVVHAVLALILLLIATWLAVYKPFGVTPYAGRTNSQSQESSWRAGVPLSTIPSNAESRTQIWMYVIAFVVLGLMLVVVLLHLRDTSFGISRIEPAEPRAEPPSRFTSRRPLLAPLSAGTLGHLPRSHPA